MSFNILDLVKDQLGSSFVGSASKYLGESKSSTSKAMDALLPTILGSIAQKGSNAAGVKELQSAIGNLDSGLLDNMTSMFKGGSSNMGGLLNSGGGLLDLLVGNKLGGLGSLISSFSGMKSSSSSTLLRLAAPFIMSIISKKIGGMGINSIIDLFKGQKDNIKAGLPKGFDISSLGVIDDENLLDKAGDALEKAADKVGDTAKDVAKGTINAAEDVADAAVDAGKKGMSFLKWLLPLFLILMFLAYFFGFRTGCSAVDNTVEKANNITENVVETTAEVTTDVVKGAVSLTGDALKGAFSVVDDAAKATLDGIKFVAGSAGDQITKFIEGGFSGDNRFRFANLTFATGSADINLATAIEVDNLAAILKAYPNVRVMIEGFTDNTGDAAANLTLSQNRAQAVKNRLISQGITDARILTAGLGSAQPVASNDTAEGRAQNRRIEIRIIK